MVIYRIENAQGKGPYTGLDSSWHTRCHSSTDTPEPEADGIEEFTTRHKCGFKSLAQLLAWFSCNRELVHLWREGFKVKAYSVKKAQVLQGKKQLAYLPSGAIEKRVIDIRKVAKGRKFVPRGALEEILEKGL